MLTGSFEKKGYDWWWHSFTSYNEKTGKARPFFIEFFTCNPKLGGGEPRFGQRGDIPSYVMVKCGTWGEDACQLHRFFGWNKVKVGRKVPLYVSADDCYVDETCIKGTVKLYIKRGGEYILVDDMTAENVGCEYGEYDRARI